MKYTLFSIVAIAAFALHAGSPYDLKQTVSEVQTPERVFVNANGNICVDFGKDAFGWVEISAPKPGLNYFLGMGELLHANGVLGRNPAQRAFCGRCVAHGKVRLPAHPDGTGSAQLLLRERRGARRSAS